MIHFSIYYSDTLIAELQHDTRPKRPAQFHAKRGKLVARPARETTHASSPPII